MNNRRLRKRILSIFIAVLMAMTALTPGITALAGDVIGYYEIQLFYENGTIVPDKGEEDKDFILYMKEGDTLQLNYQFIDCDMPNNGYIKWYSESPALVDVDTKGLVKAFDSSKGAVIHLWIDNEVKTIPLVGSLLATAIEKVLFNDYIDLDTMDTQAIIDLVEGAFGSDSVLAKYVDSYKGDLTDSLRYYLDNINSNIHVTLYDADGKMLADDFVQVCVLKNDAWYANFLPNGTHITNKSNIETTVAKGSETQIYAVTTPTRLNMGVVYSVKSSSIFSQGKVVATVNDSGLVSFKNTGEVTILVSPDTEQFVENILKFVNYFYTLQNTGTLDTDQIAGILIDYIGIDMNRSVLKAILDVCFAVVDIVQDTADPVQLTATAIVILSNIILQFVYNDSITFTVVDGVPCTDFSIEGASAVQEGAQIQLKITNAKPVAADISDITWESSDESVAYVDPKTGIITGRDAGGSLGALSQKTATITATSAANNVQKSVTITVTGKTGKYLSDAVIKGKTYVNITDEQDLTYNIYPARVATADNLYLTWGLVTEGSSKDSYKYVWASDADTVASINEEGLEGYIQSDGSVSTGIGKIDKDGHYTAVAGGTVRVALKAVTGYYILDKTFYEISSIVGILEIFNGQPVSAINVSPVGSNSSINTMSVKEVDINGEKRYYATIEMFTEMNAYATNGAKTFANVLPADATNKKVKWYASNSNFELVEQDNSANTINVRVKYGVTTAQSTNVYCVSEDGEITSDVMTLAVVKHKATGNKIDQGPISVTNGKTASATHSMTFKGTTGLSYACYDANWYSSDETVFTVKNNGDTYSTATITGVDVGTATLYCVSADGGIVDTAEITVYPDKDYLREIVEICENTVIKRTDDNKTLYKDFSKKLDYAYYILYDEPMANQDACDTYAQELLYAFYKLGGYIGLNGVSVIKTDGSDAGNYISVPVSTLSYKSTSYNLKAQVAPKNSMYRSIEWKSSSSTVTVDRNGKCTPTENETCWAVITVTATDYMGTRYEDSVVVAFAKTQATGMTLDQTSIKSAKVGETVKLTANISPAGFAGVGKASLQSVIWESSDTSVATVDSSGTVTFVYGGDCVITATACDGGFKATCSVNVVTNYGALQGQITTYKSLNLLSSNYFPETWDTYQKAIADSEAMIAANVATQKEVNAMFDKLVAAYSGLEKYTYINKVEIYLNGEAASEFYQYDLSFLSEGISYVNAKLDLNVRLYPNNASYDTVVWESSTPDITITSDGVASPTSNKVCYGQITCTVTDHYGRAFVDTVWVSFAYYIVTAVKLSETEIAGSIGETHQLTATIEPTGTSLLHIGAASIKDYYWESLNEDIAIVDDKGIVTFTGTGVTTIRAVSYDGGVTGSCTVSTTGNRIALKAAIDEYASIDYMNYEYAYGIAFKAAYEYAKQVFDDPTKSQSDIDNATADLISAVEALNGRSLKKVETVVIDWVGNNNWLGTTQKGSGKVSTATDALSINMDDGGYNSMHYYNSVVLSASALPVGANVVSTAWSVDSARYMEGEVSDNKLTLKPTKISDDSWAVVTAKLTDVYGREYTRTFTVVMAWYTVTGVTLDKTEKNDLLATDSGFQLNAAVTSTSNKGFRDVTWSSSDESVAKVNSSGYVTPVDIGTATITVRTFDGGYTATCKVKVSASYSDLEARYGTYSKLVSDVADKYVYTEASLSALQSEVAATKTMLDNYRSTQAEINEQVKKLDDAYNGLVRYIIADGIKIGVDTTSQASVTEPNAGYIRFTNSTSINNKTIQLSATISPQGGLYSKITWRSSNSDIKVDENGLCTNTSASAGYATITCEIVTYAGLEFSSSVVVSFVRYGVEKIEFANTTIYGSPQGTATLSPTITSSALIPSLVLTKCTYMSSDTNVATVNDNGVVTFVGQGSATINATSCDGGHTASVQVYTTWDKSALQAALYEAKSITYTDYEYSCGIAFKNAYDAANEVNDDPLASQQTIDAACYNLTTAMSCLAGNEFMPPGDITITNGSDVVKNTKALVVDENNTVTLHAAWAEGAMIKNSEWSSENALNVTGQTDANGDFVLTKTNSGESASITVTMTLTDDYDRTYTKIVSVKLVDEKTNISSFAFTYNNEEVSEVVYSCGGVYTGKSVQLGINTYPADADAYTSIKWSSSSSNLTVNQSGVVTASGMISSYTATITCVITLEDGTEVTNTLTVTFNRS